jgi:hypothetical protein
MFKSQIIGRYFFLDSLTCESDDNEIEYTSVKFLCFLFVFVFLFEEEQCSMANDVFITKFCH